MSTPPPQRGRQSPFASPSPSAPQSSLRSIAPNSTGFYSSPPPLDGGYPPIPSDGSSSFKSSFAEHNTSGMDLALTEAEDAPLTGNAYGPGGYTSNSNVAFLPEFMNQDPYGKGGRPKLGDRALSAMSGASDIEWKQRAGAVKRGPTRRVKLSRFGHFITEYNVPSAIINSQDPRYREMAKSSGRTEFEKLRYSAATADPNFFTPEEGWSLRAKTYGRETELMIAITSYNEDKALYARTLHSVMTNVRDIVKSKGKFWKSGEAGHGGWEKIVVCLVADGIEPMDKGTLDLLSTVGVYQDNVMKKNIDGKETVAHIFEYTTCISIESGDHPSLIVPMASNDKHNLVPVQIIFCLKQRNAKKINNSTPKLSFSLILVPNQEKALSTNSGLASTTRSMSVALVARSTACSRTERSCSIPLWPLRTSYRAIQGRPLHEYFHGDSTNPTDATGGKGADSMSLFTKNMYLAEDRILCFELCAKAGAKWTLTYVKSAKGETDVPEGTAELIGQRRRWLNGTFAASVYSIVHFYRIYRTNHNFLRLFILHVQLIFNIFSLIFTWFALANLWLSFSIIIDLVPNSSKVFIFYNAEITHWVNLAFQWIYAATLILQFVLALGNRPKGEVGTYVASFIIFGFFAYYLLACAVILTIKAFSAVNFQSATTLGAKALAMISGTNGVLLAALLSTYGIYLISSLMYLDPWHLLTSFPAYIAVAPSMINILNVYAFSNLHDVSWGTKGSDKADALPSISSSKDGEKGAVVEEVQKSSTDLDIAFKETVKRALTPVKSVEKVKKPTAEDDNKTFRTRLVAVWLLTNGALVVAIQNANGLNTSKEEQQAKTSTYFNIILWCTAGLALVRFLGCFWFWLLMMFRRCLRKS